MNLKQNKSKKFHVFFIFLGIISIVIGAILYCSTYKKFLNNFTYENILYMSFYLVILLLGIVLVLGLINFNNKTKIKIITLIIVFLIYAFIFSKLFRFGIILSLLNIVFFIVVMRFKNIFSTTITMLFCAIVFFISIKFILKVININIVNINLLIYVMFSLFIVIYRLIGKCINQFFIFKILGFEEESKAYDNEQLKNQILFVYMFLFILLNIWLYQNVINDKIWNLVNNSFLTGLTIIQIDWNKILNYFNNELKNIENKR